MAGMFRQLTILQLLPRYPRRTSTGELQQRLEERGHGKQHIRTIQRDLVHLARYFPITCDEGRPGGWSWLREAEDFSLPDLDPRTALTLHMTQQFFARLLPGNCVRFLDPHFHRAAEVLDALPDNRLGSWRAKVAVVSRHQPLQAPEIKGEILEVVYDALLEGRQLQGDYRPRSGGGADKEYRIHPLGIIFADQIIYLVGTLFEYEDIRLLALHRLNSAQILNEPARVPADFNLNAYVESGALGFGDFADVIQLVALFDEKVAYHLRETALSPDQTMTELPGNKIQVTATVPNSDQLRWWLRAFGSQVEILAPKSLREEFTAEALALSRTYGGT